MKRLFLILLAVLCLVFYSNSQNFKSDSTVLFEDDTLKHDALNLDSIKFSIDSLEFERIQDTLRRIFNIKDTNTAEIKADTLNEIIDSVFEDSTFNRVLNYVKDSLYFDEPDSIHYVIYNLNNLIENNSIQLSDSTKQAINKLINYSTSRKIDPAIEYLQTQLKTQYSDTSLKTLNDSIYNAIEYLIKSIPDDSVKISFTNLNNDSVLFESSENEIDSIHLNLVDNRGEYGVLWIKKTDANVFDIFLEDGVFIEKTKHRKSVDQRIKSEFVIPEIKNAKKVDITVGIWEFEGLADIKFSQGYISPSWSEGGENSFSALSVLKYSADYSYGKKRSLDTDVEYRLGYLKAGDNDLQKNDDKFELNLKYGKSAFKKWYYSALLNFKTQLFEGKEYVNDTTVNVISEFLSPAYLVFSLGLDYKPSNKLTVMISPVTSKFTIVADTANFDQTRFGVGQDELVRKEIGAYVKAISKLKFRDNIELENKINFFTNYTKNPQNIDVEWEANLAVKLTDYIKMSVNAHLIYDDDVAFIDKDGRERGARTQFKELFGIGFTYSF